MHIVKGRSVPVVCGVCKQCLLGGGLVPLTDIAGMSSALIAVVMLDLPDNFALCWRWHSPTLTAHKSAHHQCV